MARLHRICPVGIPQHVIQRGNNRQLCFNSDEDFAAYAHWLKEYATKYQTQIHAWVFMRNHVHLLVTPSCDNAVSQMMQSLGLCYVRYYNKKYQRSGTLWEGRFKSCLVETAEYLLQCYRYIELNPVRALMVSDPSEYRWSSYRNNGLGVYTPLITPHNEYLRLGNSSAERLHHYRELFKHHLDESIMTEIRDSVNKGLVFGSDKVKDEVEYNLKRQARPGKVGRKPKEMLL